MKVNDMTNLFVGYNEDEDFGVLICALDVQEATEIANSYRLDSNLKGRFDITEFKDVNTKFDCDYVLTSEF